MATDIATLGFRADTTEIKKADADLEGMAKSADRAGVEVEQLSGRMIKGGKSAKTYSTNVANASKTNGRLVNSAQNASYQVADLAVQLEGGTSFARAFGQQGSQLLAAFGPYGAIAGAAVAVTAALSGSFFNAAMSASELAEEIDGLVEGYGELDERQRAAVALSLNEDLDEEAKNRERLTQRIAEQIAHIEKLENTRVRGGRGGRANLAKRLGEQKEALTLLNAELANSELRTDRLNESLGKLNGTIADDEPLNAAEKLLQTLKGQEETYGQTAAQAQLYRLALAEGVTPAILEEAKALQKSLDLKIANAKADAAAENKAKRDAAAKKAEQDRINESAERIRFQMLNEEQQISESYDRRREIINASTLLSAMEKAEIVDKLDKEEGEARISSILSTSETILSTTAAQMSQLSGLFEEGSAAGKAFYLVSQGIAAASAVIDGIQAAMAIRLAYANMAAFAGPAAPGVIAAGEAHANIAMGLGVASAGMIAGQTIASFDGGGFTGFGSRTGGIDGKGGFGAILHPNETVVDHTRGQSMGGINVQVINYGGDNVQTSQDGNNLKIIIGQVKQSISNDISRGVGPVTKSLQGTFGLTRQGNR